MTKRHIDILTKSVTILTLGDIKVAKVTVKNKEYSVPEAARQLGITRQTVYAYIDRFLDDFVRDGCVEVKKKGLQKRHKIKNFERFLAILQQKGAEFED